VSVVSPQLLLALAQADKQVVVRVSIGQKMLAHGGFARTRPAANQVAPLGKQAAAQNAIQSGNPGVNPVLGSFLRWL